MKHKTGDIIISTDDSREAKRKKASAYLRAKGVPERTVHELIAFFTYDAVQEATSMQWDRVYTAIGLALRKHFNFGGIRIMRILKEIDKICTEVQNGGSWSDLMHDLRDETGVVIHSDSSDRILIEYLGGDAIGCN